jgi:pyrroloquinoline quinone biosynthesis protein E
MMPSREQVERAEAITLEYQERLRGRMQVLYVVPDYFAARPKPCMSGWGNVFVLVTPDGTALPCHAARQLPGLTFPTVREAALEWIWHDSPAFGRFRGQNWMNEPCRSCPERFNDFGGCRCQAYLLTGDAANADPVCDLSPHHHIVNKATESAKQPDGATSMPVFRNVKNSKDFSLSSSSVTLLGPGYGDAVRPSD